MPEWSFAHVQDDVNLHILRMLKGPLIRLMRPICLPNVTQLVYSLIPKETPKQQQQKKKKKKKKKKKTTTLLPNKVAVIKSSKRLTSIVAKECAQYWSTA